MKPVQGEPWPVGRRYHAACCLNYDQDHPQLLVHGGESVDDKVLGDMWIFNVETGKWTEVRVVIFRPPIYAALTVSTWGYIIVYMHACLTNLWVCASILCTSACIYRITRIFCR